jgi:uncharacterized protein (DUF2141 family)
MVGFLNSSDRFVPASAVTHSPSVVPFDTVPTGLAPSQVRHAYRLDQISFGNITGDGTGQTIAIVDAYDNPGFVSSNDQNFTNSDLHDFDQQFGIADPPSFTKIDQLGGSNYPGTSFDWSLETALDVEWIHAMAPGAKLVLVEANSSYNGDMWTACETARRYPGVSVVSMSWGTPENSDSHSFDSVFTTLSNHEGQTFLAATGDSGAPGTDPATSARVIGVGGTDLSLGANDTWQSETGWSEGGGGIAQFEAKPAYQASVTQSATKRTIPDVSFMGDDGVSVLNSGANPSEPWTSVIGTSFAVLGWSAMVAIANQGRTLAGAGTLDGAAQTLPGIYSLPSSDFHDITSGNNGFSAGPGYDLVTGRGSPIANLLVPDLVNYSRGQISGAVFNDKSGDGSLDTLEIPTASQTVFIDKNGNNTLDSGEVSTQTDAWGNYTFNNLAAGSYAIVTVPPTGFAVTGSGQRQVITLQSGANRAGVDFGFIKTGTGSISGTVYNDANGNGVRDSGESGMPGVRVFLDVNNNSAYDSFEQSTLTDSSGNYTFTGLGSGVSYNTDISAPSGFLQSNLTGGLNLSDGEHVTGHDFAVTNHPFVRGTVFKDLDGDGIWDNGDSPLPGWTVYVDSNKNSSLDPGEPSIVTDAQGNYQIGGLSLGTYVVREVPQPGFQQTLPTGGSYTITFNELMFLNGKYFGNHPITGAGSISGMVYNDLNGNGSLDTGEPGLSGITVYSDANNNGKLDTGELSNVTDSSGAYRLSNLSAGTYKVREILQAGWTQTAPSNNFGHNVTLTDGQNQTGWKFGTKQITAGGSISGTVFNDANGDLVRNAGEAGISGITLYNDANNNGRFDTGELSTVTNASGAYTFTGLGAGAYKIREILQSGWIQTTPTNNFGWTINLTTNQNLTGKDFGTKQSSQSNASLSGFAFDDKNTNGLFDAGDVKTSGKTVFLDTDNDGMLDSGERSLVTDASGNFSFTGLAAGTYHVRRVFPPGYTYSTAPIDVTLSAGQSITNLVIGSKPATSAKLGSISGFAFNDTNKNGTYDTGEQKTGGKTIFLDSNNNGKLDTGEKSVLTGSTGAYAFTNLPAGTYHVRRVFPAGYTYSTPLIDLVITSAGENFINEAIGSKSIA